MCRKVCRLAKHINTRFLEFGIKRVVLRLSIASIFIVSTDRSHTFHLTFVFVGDSSVCAFVWSNTRLGWSLICFDVDFDLPHHILPLSTSFWLYVRGETCQKRQQQRSCTCRRTSHLSPSDVAWCDAHNTAMATCTLQSAHRRVLFASKNFYNQHLSVIGLFISVVASISSLTQLLTVRFHLPCWITWFKDVAISHNQRPTFCCGVNHSIGHDWLQCDGVRQ